MYERENEMEEREFDRMVRELKSCAKKWNNDYKKFAGRHQKIIEKIKKSEGIRLLAESEIKPYIEQCRRIVEELEKIYKT